MTTRWQPLGTVWPEMNRLREETEHWLARLGLKDPRRSAGNVYPPLNAWEDDDNLCVEAELPELEYGIGDFHRTFTIGEAIDTERISAELKNRVVTVHLPESERVKPRRIEVKCY